MDIVMKENPMIRSAAVLVLEDGRIYTGTAFGALGQTLG
jgi:carbamoylphosphate synthase small subunit